MLEQVDAEWVVGLAVQLNAVATCVPQADCHMTLPAARQLATWTVCLPRIFHAFIIIIYHIYINVFLFLVSAH